jgi:hypothetical protein
MLQAIRNAWRRRKAPVPPAPPPLPPLPNNRTLDQYLSESIRRQAVEAAERPQIKAAARYWRERLAKAAGNANPGIWATRVRGPLSQAELDLFEQCLAYELSGSWVIQPNQAMFQRGGADIALRVAGAARDAGINQKILFEGFFTRIRILEDEVSHEQAPYQSGNWQVIWPLAAAA